MRGWTRPDARQVAESTYSHGIVTLIHMVFMWTRNIISLVRNTALKALTVARLAKCRPGRFARGFSRPSLTFLFMISISLIIPCSDSLHYPARSPFPVPSRPDEIAGRELERLGWPPRGSNPPRFCFLGLGEEGTNAFSTMRAGTPRSGRARQETVEWHGQPL